MIWFSILIFSSVLSYTTLAQDTSQNSLNTNEVYDESLLFTPISSNLLLASFSFSLMSPNTTKDHYSLFPRNIADLSNEIDASQISLRFTQGNWQNVEWGAPPSNGFKSGGTGAEVWALLNKSPYSSSVESNWLKLVNILSGVFCASFNTITAKNTVRPTVNYVNGRVHSSSSSSSSPNNAELLHASLPHEPVCTENLTPFIKFLPCKGKAGIATLLDSHLLFDSEWQSMAVDVTRACSADGKCTYTLQQSIHMLIQLNRASRRMSKDTQIPKSDNHLDIITCDPSKLHHLSENGDDEQSCYPLDFSRTPLSLKLSETFGREISKKCAFTSTAPEIKVLRFKEDRSTQESILTKALNEQTSTDFDLPIYEMTRNLPAPHDLNVERRFISNRRGKPLLESKITNYKSSSVSILYTETFPWYMKVFMHTLQIRSVKSGIVPNEEYQIVIRQARERKQGGQLEITLQIPPLDSIIIVFEFDKSFLRYAEHPPDANRGFDIPSAIIVVNDDETPSILRTTNLLLHMPTPDFSMPYNVIIMTSTVICTGFGSVFNLMRRGFRKPQKRGSLLSRLKEKFLRKKAVEKDVAAQNNRTDSAVVDK